MVSIDKRIEKWKSMLLDLGRRNKLIDFKESKRSTLRIIKPSINEVFDLLTSDHVLEFVYQNTKKETVGLEEQEDNPLPAVDIKLKQNQLLTDRNDYDLYHALNNIRKRYKTALEEQGVNILYVTFGLLEWKDTFQTKQVFHSPILMVPVSLIQPGPTDYFQLTISDEEILVNPSLIFKIEKDTKIQFPAFDIESLKSIADFFAEFRQFAEKHDWSLIEDVYLGLFSFIKINMYKDLEVHHTQVADHFFIRALCGETGSLPKIPKELENFDHDSVRPNDTFQVIDADSSQLDAINAVAQGHNIVLHGPPGTGKSQTITNIIADCLARNRKVLFVSEKMAALDVVYRRLIDTGLSDFCLRLHSLKTSKRDILDDLSSTLSKNKLNLPASLEGELNKLERNRHKLNAYVKALHTKCSDLDKSVFAIHGELLRYRDFPDVQIHINDVGRFTLDDLQSFEDVINEYVITTLKSKDLVEINPWSGCILKKKSLTLQQDIKIIYSRFINGLNAILESFDSFSEKMNLNFTLTIHQYGFLIALLDIASRSNNPLYQWFQNQDFEIIEKQINTHKAIFTRFIALSNDLRDQYSEKYFLLKTREVIAGIQEQSEKVSTLINSDQPIDELLFPESLLYKKLVSLSEKYESYYALYHSIQSMFCICNDSSMKSLQKTNYVLDFVLEKPYATPEWFDLDKSLQIEKLFNHTKKCHEIVQDKVNIVSDFDEEIFDLEINNLIAKFRTDYCSIFKYFNLTYYKDKKLLGSYKKNRQLKMNDNHWLALLEKIKKAHLSNTWLLENQKALHSTLGKQYRGELTDWDSLHHSILSVMKLVNFLNGQLPSSFQSILINPDQYKDLIENEIIPFQQLHKEKIHPKIASFLFFDSEDLDLTKEQITKMNNHLSNLRSLYSTVHSLQNKPDNKPITQMLDDLINLATWQKLNKKIISSKDEYVSLYEEYFLGLETNWDELLKRIDWCKEMATFLGTLLEEYLPFIQTLCEMKECNHNCSTILEQLQTWQISSSENLEYVKKQFDQSVRHFDTIKLNEMSKWLQECINNMFLLEVWIDYHNALEKCYQKGLKQFMNVIIQDQIPPDQILGTFYKRFYRLWLDEMYTLFPDIEDFRGINHGKVISDFQEEDKSQFLSAQLRINQICRDMKPEMNAFTIHTGEMGILNKELNKKKRIKPLRILFKEIPELLMSIKPCLMMSPLSVSLLLEPTRYQFDVVVFDEASQIFTEDAIGAIYRGKQLVIAGDNQQLPPTTFFMASTSDGEEEYDEENDDDTDSYESVLDEAKTIMPERKLLWHYRSRHEHLIAFSNNQIYNNSLITFPSLYERANNLGVEYYYIPEGLYDRGKKRNNVEEAKKVVDLIRQHIKDRPNMSLGVISFSISQQLCIEDELRRYRINHPEDDVFFNENKIEPFFIKNLETVQGDERDYIILSIGYGKDSEGKLSMNFGPLNRNGGYRRLNVAITRAKLNLKLVGSIMPYDFDFSNKEIRGVKLLHDYITFALKGPYVLPDIEAVGTMMMTESPFEKEVLSFLQDHHFLVDAQVGCSGFRIDLAIRDPENNGKYVLGIECDGAAYHSARTARDRDRLRQEVLEDRGWKLYRIWSTDWVKDFPNETKRLLKAVHSALEHKEEDTAIPCTQPNITKTVIDIENQNDVSLVEQYCEEIKTNTDDACEYYGFEPYISSEEEIHNMEEKENSDSFYKVYLKVLDNECPIHIDLLTKRVAFLYNRQKATSVVHENVRSNLRDLSELITKRNNFIYMANKEIKVRIPVDEKGFRSIEHISPEELQSALLTITRKQYGITFDELINITTRVFGFNRSGQKISKTLSAQINSLIIKKILSMDQNSNRIKITNEE